MGIKAKSMNYETEAPARQINILTSITVNGREYPVPDHLQDCREIECVSGVVKLNSYRLDLETGEWVAVSKPMPYFLVALLFVVALILYIQAR